MSDAAVRLATFEDLLRLPEDVRAEILEGQVITSPAPLPKHSKAQRALGSFVGRPLMTIMAMAVREDGGFSSRSMCSLGCMTSFVRILPVGAVSA